MNLEQLREKPQKECGIESSVVDQALAVQDIDHAFSAFCSQPVADIETGFPEECLTAVYLQSDNRAKDRGNGCGTHLAVHSFIILAVIIHMIEHGLEILEIDQKKSIVVSDLKNDRKNIGLQLIKFEDAGKKKGLRAKLFG